MLNKSPLRRFIVPANQFGASIIITSLLTLFGGEARAVLISADLGAPHTLTNHTSPSSFDTLDGTRLYGQTLSLNVSFLNGEFVRLFNITSWTFDAAIKLQTNGSGLLGFLDGTGYLVDSNGDAIPGYGVTGSASGADGSFSLGFYPLLKDKDGTHNTDLLRPFDFYGIHYDLTLPDLNDPSIQITLGQLMLSSAPGGVFGIGPGLPRDVVPESGSTVLLLGMAGLLVVFLAGRRRGKIGERR
jgi:hypothetical protein